MNDKLFFELKLKIQQAIMFGLDVSKFIEQLLVIENELNNSFKADKISDYYYKGQILNNPDSNLSVSMIVKNESANIRNTLESIKLIADEIIIVDTGSEDDTIDICKEYTDKIYNMDWRDDFSYARNYSLDKCNGNWVLYIDADEVLSQRSIELLSNNLKNIDDEIGLLICKVINYGMDNVGEKIEYVGQYPRIFRNLGFPLVHFFGRIHEQIGPSLLNYNFQMRNTDIEIIHNGYLIPNEEMQKKVQRNLQILANHIQEDSSNAYTWYQLGNTFYQMKEYKQSIEVLENALKCNNLSALLQSNTCLALSNAYLKTKNVSKATDYARQSLKINPKNKVAEILLAHLLNKN
ncbi:MAG TPA: glycosyltransferase [Candidatus Kapabacteria bacterium]|nr:glycosyltransferase [Candidatus Kapabacteria bacterium]